MEQTGSSVRVVIRKKNIPAPTVTSASGQRVQVKGNKTTIPPPSLPPPTDPVHTTQWPKGPRKSMVPPPSLPPPTDPVHTTQWPKGPCKSMVSPPTLPAPIIRKKVQVRSRLFCPNYSYSLLLQTGSDPPCLIPHKGITIINCK